MSIERYRGSNLPAVASVGLGRVVVVGSKVAAPAAFAGAAIGGDLLINGINNMPVPDFINNIPLIGHPVASIMMGTGTALQADGGILTMALAAGIGYVGYKKIGKPLQQAAKDMVRKHGLE